MLSRTQMEGLADDLARPFTVTILSPVLMASRKASGDGRGKKSKSKKIKAEPTYETVSDDEPEANAGDYGVPLIYDFVPNIGNGDVVMENGDGETVLTRCRGCQREFVISDMHEIRQLVHHCLRDCELYQIQAFAAQCGICHRYCMDDATLVKHRTSIGTKCALPDFSGSDAEVLNLSPVPGPSCTTTIEAVRDFDAPATSNNEPPVIDLASCDRPSTPRLDSVCYEYVPDETTGDVVVWSGTCKTIESTVCKGCHKVFATLTAKDQVLFVNHCITECQEYEHLGLKTFCYPCRVYCMDENAFIEHIVNTDSCPANSYLHFKPRGRGTSNNRPANGRTTQHELIPLD